MLQQLRDGTGEESVAVLRGELQRTMTAHASVSRTEAGLRQAAADLARLRARYEQVGVSDTGRRYNTELLEAVELGFLLDLAQVLVASALDRRETRGAHHREDFPDRDDERFLHHTLAYRQGDQVRLDHRPVAPTRQEPA
jgi:succinate dehydrogenase / fumarate reductase flavoprotein subunit